ncbi:MAG: DevR family CRISPR-associated autoregulator [Candidatus Brocadia sp.]|nr:DevR family CRISPR-associated autoregulator [Candidatus Brocadia sp.]
MKLWSISFAYRLGLGFHALNNEGSDGSNLMQPRRIDVGSVTYDGISGEIVRRHILENFVDVCRSQTIAMLPLSEGLHPDRGPIGIRAAARNNDASAVTLDASNLFPSVRAAIEKCAVLDAGGFLAAWKDAQGGANAGNYIAESDYINRCCATIGGVDPVKRESCFDVAWLISENPQDLTVTQHSAFRDTASMNSRYAQSMRSNTYGGVIRADLHRIGTDDYWYLQNGQNRLAITPEEQKKRQVALIEAIINFIASPTGAKTAGWAPHVFLTEGAILLTSARTAPFASPIKVDLTKKDTPVQADSSYAKTMEDLNNNTDTWVWKFNNVKELLEKISQIKAKLEG